MLDVISRTAAIAAIENARQLFALPDDVPGSRMVNAGFAAARGALEKVTPESGWISVKDRLPKKGVRVLVYCHYDYYTTLASYCEYDGYGCFCGSYPGHEYSYFHDVSHWQPLPAPPEG